MSSDTTTAPLYATENGIGNGPQVLSTSKHLEVLCGPLLNYKHTSNANSASPIWHGSILIVTKVGQKEPSLNLRCLGPVNSNSSADGTDNTQSKTFQADKLYEDPRCGFWRFAIDLPLQGYEAKWEYHIPNVWDASASTKTFCVPAITQSMRILFHSCNGFSAGTDEAAFSGTPLWGDVLRQHEQKPIHVMIGGGDQIYNDGIRVTGPLRPWTDIRNPQKRRDYPFNENLRAECDDFYLKNYIRWFSTKPFSDANAVLPQLNIWDDHDIIDGFGSYTDHFMKCAVFRGIGGIAQKYYLLFQHHETIDISRPSVDPEQLKNTFVMVDKNPDPSWIFGKTPGPYVEEKSRSLFCRLGAHIAFLGIDARTERTRHQINYTETYDLLFNRVSQELTEAQGAVKHFILLLGVPIAYPRLQWLENILSSPIIGPIRFLSKRFGVGGGLFNNFDGAVDLLDDLDDHYTAHQHKVERRLLVQRIQKLAKDHNVRVTILGGDVHLAALGRFYSNPHLNIPVSEDHRFVTNIVSSAITNKPPPQAVANLLARRNKIHHLDPETDETLLNLFDKDPGLHDVAEVGKKTADANHCTMPSRNYALITPSSDGGDLPATQNGNGIAGHEYQPNELAHHRYSKKTGNPREPMHAGEEHCGTTHPAASGLTKTGLGGKHGLDVTIRVEINPRDREGKTQGYGFTIPTLEIVASGQHRKVDEAHGV